MRRPQEVSEQRAKYGRGAACLDCGEPTDSVAVRCEPCVEQNAFEDEVEFSRGWLRDHPRWMLMTAHDRSKIVHLVLFRLPDRGWCGAKLTQLKSRRVAVMPGMFPITLCPACLALYEEIA